MIYPLASITNIVFQVYAAANAMSCYIGILWEMIPIGLPLYGYAGVQVLTTAGGGSK